MEDKDGDGRCQSIAACESVLESKAYEGCRIRTAILISGDTKDKGSEQVDVFAAEIQPKIASSLLRQLNLCSPLPSLNHLKRVRKTVHEDGVKLSIILCLVPHGTCEWSLGNAPREVSALVHEYQLIPFITTVPQYEACSRKEWEYQCRFWPASYHPNAVKLHQVPTFEEIEIKDISKFMKIAIKQAQLAIKAGQPCTGAAIVNPSTGLIVAAGHDETGGWMNTPCNLKPRQVQVHSCNDSDDNTNAWLIKEKIHSWHPLRHAVMVAIERAAQKNKEDKFDHIVNSEDADEVNINLRPSDEAKQYLCTGFDAYITHEPCAMCAMALLHQRVRRVFYGIPNLKIGALGGSYKLHAMQGLNHHFLVFHVPLSEADIVE